VHKGKNAEFRKRERGEVQKSKVPAETGFGAETHNTLNFPVTNAAWKSYNYLLSESRIIFLPFLLRSIDIVSIEIIKYIITKNKTDSTISIYNY